MTKQELTHDELAPIVTAIKNLRRTESVDIVTDWSARKLTPRLHDITSDDGFCMAYRCTAIAGGVRITCTSKFKIGDVHVVGIKSNG
jgi:hypothetical protein